jgi:serine/threonine protein kinase
MLDSTKVLAQSQFLTLNGEAVIVHGGDNKQDFQRERAARHLTNEIIDQKYKIISLLGEGGMGAVYKAHHLMLNKDVALKTFRSPNLTDDSWKRFQREAQAIARLSHINIVQVFDFGVGEDNVPYYTMECLSGESLEDRLAAGGPLPLDLTIKIFLQVCQGLSAAHNKGIIHRDLKPANIFLASGASAGGKSDLVKIVDFGIAGLATQSIDGQKLTATGTIFGSPLYMSPEQSIGEAVTERSDIYSCGCALFESLTGSPPFRGENAFATMMQHQQRPVPRLNDVAEGRQFPQRLHALITKMLAKQERDRFQSFEELSAELQEILKRLEPSAETLRRDQSSAASSEIQESDTKGPGLPLFRPSILIMLCCLICLAAVGSWIIFSRPGKIATQVATKQGTPLVPEEAGGPYRQSPDPNPGWHRFKFPQDESLGKFTWTFEPGASHLKDCDPNQQAQGLVDVPPKALVQLTAMEAVAARPKLFSGFGASDLDGLTLDSKAKWDKRHTNYIGKLTGLCYLNINHSKTYNDCIADLNKLSKLRTLQIRDTEITGTGVGDLNMLPNLEHFETSGTEPLSAALQRMVNSQNIKHLVVDECQLTDKDMNLIGTMSNLEVLSVKDNEKITDHGLKAISTLKKLSNLTIDDTYLTTDCIATLKAMTALKTLNIKWKTWRPEDQERLSKALLPHCHVVGIKGVFGIGASGIQ